MIAATDTGLVPMRVSKAVALADSPREIGEHPRTRFVAGFIGTSNLLSGTVARVTGARAVIEVSPDERVVVLLHDVDADFGKQFELTVRPEKIDLGTEPSLPGRCPVGGIVTEVVCFGTSTKISITPAAGGDIVVFRQNPASAGAVAARDDAVWLWWQPEHSCPIG